MQKGFAPIVLVLSILLFGLGFGGAYYYKSNLQPIQKHIETGGEAVTYTPAPDPNLSEEEIKDGIYKNYTLNFQIEVPKDWVVETYNSNKESGAYPINFYPPGTDSQPS